MAQPITVKKKKMTIKKKAPKADAPQPAKADAPQPAKETPAPAPAAAVPATPEADNQTANIFNKQPVATTATAANPRNTIYAILALLTTFIFLAIIGIQFLERSELNDAFPRPIPVTGP